MDNYASYHQANSKKDLRNIGSTADNYCFIMSGQYPNNYTNLSSNLTWKLLVISF